MADAKLSDEQSDAPSQYSRSGSQPDELEVLREETKRLRRLVIELSKVAIRNALNAK
jgi:hypothetical protein